MREIDIAILQAIATGRKQSILNLIEQGADIYTEDTYANTLLHKAALYGKATIIKLLLDLGLPIDKQNSCSETPLCLAVKEGHYSSAKILCEKGANVNSVDYYETSLLHRAAIDGYYHIVKLLVKHGANINTMQRFGATPLYNAVNYQNVGVVKFLLRQPGLDTTTPSYEHKATPFMRACELGNKAIFDLFIKARVDVTLKDFYDKTALHYVAKSGFAHACALLLKMGLVDVNAVSTQGETALYTACAFGHVYVAKLLLEAGANPRLPCKRQNKPLTIARMNNKYLILNLLKEYGATE